jgi:hypothetical protein
MELLLEVVSLRLRNPSRNALFRNPCTKTLGQPHKSVNRPAKQFVKPDLFGRVKHLRGEEDPRHASLQDFREES